ncbi:HTH-type transcriptional regulator FrlR [Hartmannibacter diazotrophicus]|uniref:HTH-type transcriptional regulator FrlR n=1 Tax=Hartmannibacter diazotrophicus TaxID=1482074 RepID=A0A2C9D8V4_9HYPH|nr:GntR family transcriptional regulator [Hartmannibacter diazotrophicus]SON56663.1 HTH-type transcriptional regulator FrlR [Hartmannibacter diazotrophicus]
MSQTLLSGDARLPIYQRLADVLRAEVVEGRLRPGDRVPSESELCERYGLALGTVRKGLEILVAEGLFERFHGRGTFVRRPKFDSSLFRFFRFRGTAGAVTVPEGRILRRTTETVPGFIAKALAVPEGSEGISMSRIRLCDGEPVLAEEIWLPLPRFADFLSLEIGKVGDLLYPVYDAECQQLVARAEEQLTAERASEATARLLRIEPGTPVIVIDRLARGYDGTPLEWRRSRGRADQFCYQIEIR